MLSAGKDFRRKANLHGSHIRSTSPRGGPFDRDWSLVAACREVLLGKQDLQKSATAPQFTTFVATLVDFIALVLYFIVLLTFKIFARRANPAKRTGEH